MKRDDFDILLLNILEWMPRVVIIVAVLVFVAVTCSCVTKRIEVEKPVVVEKIHHDTVIKKENVTVVDSVWIVDTIIQYADGKERTARFVYHSRSNDKATEDKNVSKDKEQEPVYITVTKEKKVMDVRTLATTSLFGLVVGGLVALLVTKRRKRKT